MMRRAMFCLAVLAMCGCVTTKKYNEMRGQALSLEGQLANANIQIDKLRDTIDRLNRDNRKQAQSNDSLAVAIAGQKAIYDTLLSKHAALDNKYKALLEQGSAEAARMLRQLERSQEELNARSRKIEELNNMLEARDKALADIRKKVSAALVGFENKGLTISTRGGQVYVSMDDKLLFKSGSYDIDARGAQAVRDLAGVLAQNKDINIMVEGHTDNVPYRTSGQLLDNLDLSAKRATTVVRLLLANPGIAPERITAAGRGEYLPVDNSNTSDGRARNRRTEIILTPKLDELMQIASE